MKKMLHKKAFTLVELIVVIVILAVLASIAFITLQDYPKDARDTVRKTDINTIEKALALYATQNGTYPEADIITLANGGTGTVLGTGAIQALKTLPKIPTDPKTEKPYFYKNFGTWGYKLETELETTGETIKKIQSSKPRNCQEILGANPEAPDGNYTIYPGATPITVECDMTTEYNGNTGGWTRYLNIKANYTMQEAKNCWLGQIVSTGSIDCFNPIKQDLKAREFLAKQTVNGTETSYTYTSNSDNDVDYVKTERATYRCLGGEDYMTVMQLNNIEPVKDLSSGVSSVWLGLNFCKYNYQLGGVYSPYMNYSTSGLFGPIAGGRESTVHPVKIFIR